MDDKIKYILFNPANSLYNKAFKFHRFKEIFFISIKAIEKSIGYSEKLFPGDDRDQIILKTEKEVYFKISDKLMEDRLKSIISTTKEIIFAYKQNDEINTNELIEFNFFVDFNPNSHYSYSEFPSNFQIGNRYFDEVYDNDETNWDEL